MTKQEKSLTMTVLMTPDMANFSGNVHGGSLLKLLDHVTTREQRMSFERIFGLLCCYEKKELFDNISVFGDIHDYTYNLTRTQKKYDYYYHEYLHDKENNLIGDFPIVKVWTGR